ncbi:hypothetical protein [Novosphingobium aureum]|uniref:hypothetical protein n=1 Tax=Novosphingobium aureum TaxID=2792964 RepID=UPI002B46028F|nr:hypothetical protein [Novosphingobium aureum]
MLLDSAKFDQFYDRVRSETAGIVVDLSTKKGRDEVRSLAAKVTRSKTMIDKAGLALTRQWREQTNQVNAARKEIEERLSTLAEEVRRPLTEWENTEKERVESCRAIIDEMKQAAVVTIEDTAASVRARGMKVWGQEIGDQFGDMAGEAQSAKESAVETLKAALARLTREEEERAELEKLRAEAAEREAREQAAREEREAKERAEAEARQAEERRVAEQKAEEERASRIAREAEERARREAEVAAQAERDRIQREHDEALAAERRRAEQAEREAQAERDRIAKEEADRKAEAERIAQEQAAREADRAHRGKIMAAAKEAIMEAGSVDEATAKNIVLAIVGGSVPNVTLRF